jgi:phosphopantothenoylcysteine decarboxylase/phosphopantothenate--cysteine ligase
MGVALADEAARHGWQVTLLLGPAPAQPSDSRVVVQRFRTCSDLQTLLRTHVPQADVLVMAAAVADYRPVVDPAFFGGKFRRKNQALSLNLEPTPDLLAEVAETRRADQLFVGFALEPREELLEAAKNKLARKRVDMVVANPLETMDSSNIDATILTSDGRVFGPGESLSKGAFAQWLVAELSRALSAKALAGQGAQ